MKTQATYRAPWGLLDIVANDNGITAIGFGAGAEKPAVSHPYILQLYHELDAYFAGKQTTFSVPLAPEGTFFMQNVWKALQKIPYGTTASYQDIAGVVGKPKAMRAVGMANNSNPLPIVIPCHRVIGKDGSLTGYAGGLPVKEWLLRHEGVRG
jgi:methylated-DNA-[protein]-cysteine S-methyltransferase